MTLERVSSQTRASLWPRPEQSGLGLEGGFLAVFLQGKRCCKILNYCREQLSSRGCCSWEEEWRQCSRWGRWLVMVSSVTRYDR